MGKEVEILEEEEEEAKKKGRRKKRKMSEWEHITNDNKQTNSM